MTQEHVTLTAEGPTAVQRIRDTLSALDLDKSAIRGIEVTLHFGDDAEEPSDDGDPEPTTRTGRLRANTFQHAILYTIAESDKEWMTSKDLEDAIDQLNEKQITSTMTRLVEKNLVERQQADHDYGLLYEYQVNRAGEGELVREGEYDPDETF